VEGDDQDGGQGGAGQGRAGQGDTHARGSLQGQHAEAEHEG
jgi:hypothetical protein